MNWDNKDTFMQPKISHITSKAVKRLKNLAKEHKKKSNTNHTDSLEFIAKQKGFDSWHHVTLCEKRMKPTELAYEQGIFVIFEGKEGEGVYSENNELVEDYNLFVLCKNDLINALGNSTDHNDPSGSSYFETTHKDDIKEWIEDDYMFSHFFRIAKPEGLTSITDVLKMVSKHSFWPPKVIFMAGKMFNSFDNSTIDEDGNIVGIQM